MSSNDQFNSASLGFQQAARYLTGPSRVLPKVSNDVLLELYGLYKFVTVGSEPQTSRPSVFSYRERAKYDAWSSAGEEYKQKGKEAAERRYVAIAIELGWHPGEASQGNESGAEGTKASEEPSAEELLERDSADEERKDEAGGLGNAVSTMGTELGVGDEDSLHGFAIQGDLLKLSIRLGQHPATDINSLDEYGYTPLLLACDRGHRPVVEFLLEKGADITIKDEDGLSAVDLAREAGHEEIVQLLTGRSDTDTE